VTPIDGYPDAFKLTRLVNDDDAPLELDGMTARLFVQQVVVVENGSCKTESYVYRLSITDLEWPDVRANLRQRLGTTRAREGEPVQ
jgi:hypothetical protein